MSIYYLAEEDAATVGGIYNWLDELDRREHGSTHLRE
jgi:hypothetical protein